MKLFTNNIILYLINLKKNKDRFMNINKHLNELKKYLPLEIIHIETYDYINSKEESLKYISYDNYINIINHQLNRKMIHTWGELGKFLSHINCWKSMIKNNIEYAFIIQDNVEILDFLKLSYKMVNVLQLLKKYKKRHNNFKKPCIFHIDVNNDNMKNSEHIDFDLTNIPHTTIPNFQDQQYFNNNLNDINNLTEIENDIFKSMKPLYNYRFYCINIYFASSIIDELFPINFKMNYHLENIIRLNKSIYIHKVCNSSCCKNIIYISDSKYFFICKNILKQLFKNIKIDYDIINIIYKYLPKKKAYIKMKKDIYNIPPTTLPPEYYENE